MKINMGRNDRTIRMFLAVIAVLLYFMNVISGTFGFIALILAVVFLTTSFFGTCPLYSIFGINTCEKKKM
jgi:predicted membrane protein